MQQLQKLICFYCKLLTKIPWIERSKKKENNILIVVTVIFSLIYYP